MKINWRNYLFLLVIAAVLLTLDQVTKELVRRNLAFMEIYRPDLWLSNYVRILHWRNTGAAFGMFENGNYVFMALSSLVSLAILYYFPRVPVEEKGLRLALSLLFSGAVGNLIDRFRFGYVTDFISVGYFPVFNVADSCITLGVVALMVDMVWQEWRNRRTKAPSTPSASEGETESDQPGLTTVPELEKRPGE